MKITLNLVVASAYLVTMDDKWFKQRQKIAGVTAEDIAREMGRDRSVVSRIYVGRQPMSTEQAKVFASVLGVPLAEVMERAGILDANEANTVRVQGFSDSDATPWVGKGGQATNTNARAALFGGDKPGIDVWTVKSNALLFSGYVPGDFILLDTHQSERCKAGDIVIAQKYDWQGGGASTLLRRFEPPVLIADSPDPDDRRVHVVDGSNVVIMGKVIASWRAP